MSVENSELRAVYDALVQAQDCIRGETPEDMSDQEAREDTISKLREAMRTVETMPPTKRRDGHSALFWDKEAQTLKTFDPHPPLVTKECPTCNDANKFGDYEGPACEVCGGCGVVSAHQSCWAITEIARDIMGDLLLRP